MEFHFNYENEPKKLYHRVGWLVDLIAVVALAVFTVYCFGNRIVVNGSSMNPTLNSEDTVLVNRLAYDLGNPARFDIAVFFRPGSGPNIKRVIGLPGETVQIIDERIYIDGEPLDTGEVPAVVTLPGVAEYPVELGKDEYFLLGDNRESSEDSRFAAIGNVKKDQFMGKVWFRFQPFSEIGFVR